ncbi:MAG: ATP-binding protein [Pseudomonadota bacterium]
MSKATQQITDPLTRQASTVLPTACFGVAAIFFIIHALAVVFPPPWDQAVLNATGLFWSAICLLLGIYVVTRELPGAWPHYLLIFLSTGMVAHAGFVLHLLDEPIHSLNLVMIVIASGYFLTQRSGFYLNIPVIGGVWFSAFAVSAHSAADWRIWGGSLLVGGVLAVALFEARRRTVLQLHALHLEAQEAHRRQVKMERLMQETQRRESLGLLAGGIAHDFNNLLTVIAGNTELALRRTEDGDTRSLLEATYSASAKAADLTQSLLAYAGRARPNISAFDFAARVESNIALIESSLPKGISVRRNGEKTAQLEADTTLVDQIVINLLQNAADAYRGVPGIITVSWGTLYLRQADIASLAFVLTPKAGCFAYVDVSDQGAGMNEAMRLRAFEPFYSTKFEGSGLGLAAIHGIVKSHSGGLQLTSEANVGTTVRVFLPIAGAVLENEEQLPQDDPRQVGSSNQLS